MKTQKIIIYIYWFWLFINSILTSLIKLNYFLYLILEFGEKIALNKKSLFIMYCFMYNADVFNIVFIK